MLLLRNPISHTKKFFKRTLQSFKSFFTSDNYQKLPKSSPCDIPYSSYNVTGGVDMNAQVSYQDLDKFYSDFTDRWDADKEKGKRRNKKNIVISSMSKQEAGEEFTRKNNQLPKIDEVELNIPGRSSPAAGRREVKSVLVAEKLKELELMDLSNVDHVLDIEEVLHYYSRLTCPAYLDIVDKFFMEMYAELIGQPATTKTPVSVSSRTKFRSMRA